MFKVAAVAHFRLAAFLLPDRLGVRYFAHQLIIIKESDADTCFEVSIEDLPQMLRTKPGDVLRQLPKHGREVPRANRSRSSDQE